MNSQEVNENSPPQKKTRPHLLSITLSQTRICKSCKLPPPPLASATKTFFSPVLTLRKQWQYNLFLPLKKWGAGDQKGNRRGGSLRHLQIVPRTFRYPFEKINSV